MESTNPAENKGEIYYQPMGKKLTKEEMKQLVDKNEGKFDDDGFYILPDGSFYDKQGYIFDAEGYDEHGGYIENGKYYPGQGQEDEYYDRYEEQNNRKETLKQEAERLAPFMEHVIPAIDWVNQQAEGSKLTVQFKNIPISVKQNRLKSYLDAIIENLDEKGKFVFV